MRVKPVRIVLACSLLGAALCLSGCSELIPKAGQNVNMPPATAPSLYPEATESVFPEGWGETTEPEDYSAVEELAMVVTEKTIRQLEKYPNLKKLDVCGSTCYSAIMVYKQNHPEVEVTYSVDFGGDEAVNWAENIILSAEGSSYDLIERNLIFLPALQSVHLPRTNLTQEQVEMLRFLYPDVRFTFTVECLGAEYSEEQETLNLAGLSYHEILSVQDSLKRFPNLKYVELMDGAGECALVRQEIAMLNEAIPEISFHYTFNLFGKNVSTTDGTIRFEKLGLTEAAEPEIREALSILAPGSTLILDRCGLNSEFLDSIRKDYDKVDLVWRVFFGTSGRYTTLTNDDNIRCVYNVTDDTCYEMRYLRSVKYMDLGHNDTLTDLSFLGYMPELEIAILSGCAAKELSGIENCKKLEFLELANCMALKDISALAGCESLKYLNICYAKVDDLSALDAVPIQNLFCKQTRVNAEAQEHFKEFHADCTAVFTGREPYAGPGWRYTDNGYHYTDFYQRVRDVFNLDAVDATIRAQEG